MGYPSREVPELQHADFRPYLPAIRHAESLFDAELERLRRRCEAQEWSVARRNRRDLEELRQKIRSWPED